MDEKPYNRFCLIVSVSFAAAILITAIIFGLFTIPDGRSAPEPTAAGAINNAIRDGQRGDLDRTERGIEALERIRSISEETDRVIGELRKSNRRSGDILSAIEQEIDVLEDYLRSVSGIVGSNNNYSGGE